MNCERGHALNSGDRHTEGTGFEVIVRDLDVAAHNRANSSSVWC